MSKKKNSRCVTVKGFHNALGLVFFGLLFAAFFIFAGDGFLHSVDWSNENFFYVLGVVIVGIFVVLVGVFSLFLIAYGLFDEDSLGEK